MKKNLKLFLTMLFLTLLGGANSSWAGEHTVIFKTTGTSSDSSVKQTTIDGLVSEGGDIFSGVTASDAYQGRDGRGVKLGTSSKPGSMVFTLTQDMEITSIKFTAMWYKEGEQSITVNGQTFDALTSSITEYTVTLDGSSINQISISTPSKRAYIGSLTIVTGGGTTGPVDPHVVFANESEEIEVGESVTNQLTKPNDLTVTFSSNLTSVATVDADGVVTGVAEGEATITASWDAVTDKYNAGSTSYTVTVNAATPAINFVKVTNSNQLVAGNEYILVGTRAGKTAAMGARTGSNTYRDEVLVTVTDDKVAVKGNDGVAVLTLGGASDSWTFLASDNNEYIALTANSNALHSSTDATLETSKWKVTNDFQLQNASFTDRYIQYNSGSTRFACYTAGNQGLSTLYVKEGSPIDDKLDPNFVFSATEVETEVGGEFTAPTLTHAEGFYGTIVYASSNPDVATVDASTGEVTIVAAGETTISATSEAYDNFKAGSASYTLTVIDPNAPGTANNPYTVAQARAAIDAGTGMEGVYATGIVSQTDGLSNGTITYYISDDGTTTNQLEIYKGKSYDGVNFTSADDIQVGDIVVVYGNLQKYNSIYEFNATNQLVSLVRPVVPSHNVTFFANGDTFSTTTAKEGANIEFPTENPTDVGDFKFIGWSTEDWTGEVNDRPTTLVTSVTMGTEDMTIYAVYALISSTQEPVTKSYGFETETDEDWTIDGPVRDNTLANSGDYSGRINTNNTYVTFNSKVFLTNFSFAFTRTSSNNNYQVEIQVSEDGETWRTEVHWPMSDFTTSNTFYTKSQSFDGTVERYVRFHCSNTTAVRYVDDVTITYNSEESQYSYYCTKVGNYEIVDFATAGYKSYVTKNAIDWAATNAKGVEGYQVTEFSTSVVKLTELGNGIITAPKTPVILKGVKGKNLLVIADANGSDISDISSTNKLKKGSDKAEYYDNKIYVLQKSPDWSEADPYKEYNFYPLNKNRYEKDLKEWHAFLILEEAKGGPTGGNESAGSPGVQPAKIAIRFIHANDDDPMVSDDAGIIDGINGVENTGVNDEFYSISGVRVAAPTKGLYIVNGKKVLVK